MFSDMFSNVHNAPLSACYDLGYHIASGRLVRIPAKRLGVGIPLGCVRIVRYRSRDAAQGNAWWTSPYDDFGHLLPAYWAYALAEKVAVPA